MTYDDDQREQQKQQQEQNIKNTANHEIQNGLRNAYNNHSNSSNIGTQSASQKTNPVSSKGGTELANQVGSQGAKEGAKQFAKEGAKQSAKTAAGQAIGSAVPGVGNAVMAGVDATNRAKQKIKDNAHEQAQRNAQSGNSSNNTKVSGQEYSETEGKTSNNSTVVMVVSFALIPLIIIFIIILVCVSVISSVLGGVLALFNGVRDGWDRISGFVEDIGIETPSFEDIVPFIEEMINESCEESYLTTCYREVVQIVREMGYDFDLSLESYTDTEFPYYFDEENCNINYCEILSVLSLSKEYDYEHFNYKKFKELLKEQEFLRCLYDLKITPTEGLKETGLPRGASCSGSRQEKIVTYEDGSTQTYTVNNPGPYFTVVTYGEVEVNRYSLKKLYDYFNIDPYGKSSTLPNMTNYQALAVMEQTTRAYLKDTFWGSSYRSPLLYYEKYTGIITENGENIYGNDLRNEPILSDTYVYLDTTVYKQGDPRWRDRKYGSGKMANLGCCVTAMSMIIDYFTEQVITPGDVLTYIDDNYNGLLYCPKLAKDFGFREYNRTTDVNIKVMIGELKNERLINAHITPFKKGTGGYGHFVVLNGYEVINGTGFFHVSEPAGRLNELISIDEAADVFDSYTSYGR